MSGDVEGPARRESDNLTLAELAQRLNMSLNTIGRWAGSGLIPSTITAEGTWRFRLQDIDILSAPGSEPRDVRSTE